LTVKDSIKRLWPIAIVAALLTLLTILATPRLAQAGGPIYVNDDASGANDGTSWADAYVNLQDALIGANPGDEIWVAEGVYYPDEGGGQTDNDRTATFRLWSGVALYGGFDGIETSRDQRDWENHVTILSGDIDHETNPDVNTDGNYVAETWSDIEGLNAYYVVTGSGTDSTTVLDGFIITAASGIHSSGMYNSSGSPLLTNLIFSGNKAGHYGGGMHNTGNSDPTLTNVTFSGNYANDYGGGMYNTGGSDPTLTSVTFSGNRAIDRGGGLYNDSSDPSLTAVTFSGNYVLNNDYLAAGGGMYNASSDPSLTNVTFSGNSADTTRLEGSGLGGGMYNDSSSPTLANITFSGNSVSDYGAGMYNDGSSFSLTNVTFSGNTAAENYGDSIANTGSSTTTLINCILCCRESGTQRQQIYNEGSSSSAIVSYSLVRGGCPLQSTCDHLLDTDPLFVDADGPDDVVGTPDDDLHLQDASPAIDAGNNAAVPADTHDLDGDGNTVERLPYDLDGQRRFVEHPQPDTGAGAAPLVDMGTYEKSVLSLDKTADPPLLDAGDALTYTLAFTNDSTFTVTQAVITDVIPVHLHDPGFVNSGAHITPTGDVSYTWQVEELSPGEMGVITITGVLSTSLLRGQSFDNVARFAGMAGGVAVESVASVTVVRLGADLAVGKQAAVNPAVVGGALTCTLTITNHGPVAAENIVLTDALPSGVTFISASPGCSAAGNSTIACTRFRLDNQDTVAFTITVTAPVTVGQITNTVTVTAATPDPDLANNVATEIIQVSAEADLGIAKSDDPDLVLVGGLLTYTLVVTNHGPDIAGGVVLSDALPAGTRYAGRLLSLPMNETEGSTHFADVSGFGHHGSCNQQDGTCPEAGVPGLYDHVLSFDGDDDWVESADFDIDNDFTISLWVYPLKGDDAQAFIGKHTSGGGDLFIFGFYNDGYYVNLRGSAYQTGTKIADDWQHLAAVGRETGPSTTEITVYRDGQPLWQHEFTKVVGDITGKGWTIGQEWDGSTESDFFYGAIDEVNVYNRALSASEITALQASHPIVSPIVSQGTCSLDGGLTCSPGTLANGAAATVTFPVRLSSTQPRTLTNTATVTSYVPDPSPDDNSDEENTQVGTDLAVSKADALDPVTPGERLTYTLAITRHNPADVIATRITDTVANPSSIVIPAPLPTVIPYPSTISVSGLAGRITRATVTLHDVTHVWPEQLDVLLVGPGGQSVILLSDAGHYDHGFDGSTLTFDDAAPSPLPEYFGHQIFSGNYKPTNYGSEADVFPSPAPGGPYGATLSVFDGIRPNGDWSLYVVDDLPETADGAIAGGWSLNLWTGSSGTVTDVLPVGVTFVSASPDCSESSGTVTCVLGILDNQATATFTITVTAPLSVGLITNTVSVAGLPPDLNPANNKATEGTWVSEVDLAVDKMTNAAIPLEGDRIIYTVTLVNHGPVTATGVVSDMLPEGVTFGGYTATLGTYTDTTGVWQVGPLTVGDVATLTITGTVDTGTAGQLIVNTVVLSASIPADILTHNNAGSASFTVASPSLTANKAVDTGGLAEVSLGGLVTYTIGIGNDGDDVATGAVMTDPLPSGVTFAAWVEQGLGTVDVPLRTVEWGPADIAAHTAYSISFAARVTDSADFAGQTITNVVYATAANADPADDWISLPIRKQPSIYLPLVLRD
jgi:uncharacterized repeat protein (TIGR01451 family)